MPVDHSSEHPVAPSCPLACLGLARATREALIEHWRAVGLNAPVIRDLLQLHRGRALTAVSGISWGRIGEISRKLEEHGIEEPK